MTKTLVFSRCKPSSYSGVAIDDELYPKNRDVDVYIEFEVFKAKVFVTLLGLLATERGTLVRWGLTDNAKVNACLNFSQAAMT